LISKADADSAATAAVWVLSADIADKTNGIAWTSKAVSGVDTSGRTVGDKVYLSATAGAFAFAAPTGADQDAQFIGVVSVVSASSGEIQFFPALRIMEARGTSSLQASAVAATKLPAQVVTDVKRAPHTVTAQTGPSYNLLTTDHDQSFTNTGASGSISFVLPAVSAGLRYRIYRRANHSVALTTVATLDDGTTTGTTYTITSATGYVEVECDGSTWIVIGNNGTHTLA
jgi:hypothetical protein